MTSRYLRSKRRSCWPSSLRFWPLEHANGPLRLRSHSLGVLSAIVVTLKMNKTNTKKLKPLKRDCVVSLLGQGACRKLSDFP